MMTRRPLFALLSAVAVASCGAEEPEPAPEPTTAVDEQVRTADPYARGYADEDFPRLKELAPGVFSYEQLRSAGEEKFTTVSLIVVTDEGVLVGDGQGSAEETQRLLDHVAELTDQPITHVVIGSDHGDHTGGNSVFPEGVTFIAHPTSAEAMRRAAEQGASAPVPNHLVEEREVLELGGRTIEILFLGRAHTGGDLMVHLPEEKILFMSEAYLHRVFPAMRTAYPSEWVSMIERAQEMDIEWYVPGHGFVDAPEILEAELEVYRQALAQVIEEARRLHQQGVPLEEAQEQARFGELESWSLRASQGPVAIRQVYAELNGELPGGVE